MNQWLLTLLAVAAGVIAGLFWPNRRAESPQEALDALTLAIDALNERVDGIEGAEATRSAQQAEALDKFTRLYKRMAERQSRDDRSGSPIDDEEGVESPLELRRRLRGN